MDAGREHAPAAGTVFRAAGAEAAWFAEELEPDAEWCIESDRHVVIVHLEGTLRGLRTELADHGTARGDPSAGEIWSIPAGCRYRGSARSGTIRYVTLTIDASPDTAATAGLPDLAPLAGVPDAFVHGCVAQLATVTHAAAASTDRLYGEHLLAVLVLHLRRRYRGDTPEGRWTTAPGLDPAASERIRTFVADNLEGTMHLHDLARAAEVPVHSLARTFRRAFGTTPWQYVLQCRLARARELMRDTGLDLSTIALRSGFASHAHFTHCAKKHWGSVPSRLRMRSPASPIGETSRP